MKYRKPNRLKDYNYSDAGCYFVTICTNHHENCFGEIKDEKMVLNKFGEIADYVWKRIPGIYKNVILDEYVIMPNHVHGIIGIIDDFPVGNAFQKNINYVGNASSGTMKIKIQRSIYKENVNSQINVKMHSLQKDAGYKRTKMLLSKIIQAYKSEVTRRIKRVSNFTIKTPLWQKSFYDRVIRNEHEFNNIACYIDENPLRWALDIENKLNVKPDTDYYNNLFKKP